jgi:DNA-directed RNA polymerase specialized sigma24 family protein
MRVDADVLAAARAGDPRAMDSLLAAVQPDVRRCAVYYCGRSSAVDEVVQETLLIVSRRIASLKELSAFTAWILTIVYRVCLWPPLQLVRRVELALSPPEPLLGAERPLSALHHDIARALESLPVEYREVLLLRDFEGLTIGEMAARLGVSRAATKSRLHRARALAREYLQDSAP